MSIELYIGLVYLLVLLLMCVFFSDYCKATRRKLFPYDYHWMKVPPFYKSNRYLSDTDIKQHLKPSQSIFDEANDRFFRVIRYNSNWLEITDRYFNLRGFNSLVGACFLLIFVLAFSDTVHGLVTALLQIYNPDQYAFHDNPFDELKDEIITFLLIFQIMFIPTAVLFLREMFTYTYYPIRFDRKKRLIHVFRFDGSVLTLPWDDAFFCLRNTGRKRGEDVPSIMGARWDIVCYFLDSEGKFILETFPLTAPTLFKDRITSFWELIRRYMENGPEALPQIKRCVPIYQQKETLALSYYWIQRQNGRLILILFFPFMAIQVLGRWLASKTSKIPKWPEMVEYENQMMQDDPYFRDASQDDPITFHTHSEEFPSMYNHDC